MTSENTQRYQVPHAHHILAVATSAGWWDHGTWLTVDGAKNRLGSGWRMLLRKDVRQWTPKIAGSTWVRQNLWRSMSDIGPLWFALWMIAWMGFIFIGPAVSLVVAVGCWAGLCALFVRNIRNVWAEQITKAQFDGLDGDGLLRMTSSREFAHDHTTQNILFKAREMVLQQHIDNKRTHAGDIRVQHVQPDHVSGGVVMDTAAASDHTAASVTHAVATHIETPTDHLSMPEHRHAHNDGGSLKHIDIGE